MIALAILAITAALAAIAHRALSDGDALPFDQDFGGDRQ